MAVNTNVFVPPTNQVTDVRGKQNQKSGLEEEIEQTRLYRQLRQEQKLTQEIEQPPEPPKPPFQVTGGVHLGTIDLQEEQRRAREEAEANRRDAEGRMDAMAAENNQLRETIHQNQMAVLEKSLTHQIEQLKLTIANGGGNKGDFVSQLQSIEQLAAYLGYSKAPADPGNFNAQLELKRLDMEIARENRKFEMELKKDERLWQLEVAKLNQQIFREQKEDEASEKRWQAITSLPDQFGMAIGRAILERGEAGGGNQGSITSQPSQQQINRTASEPKQPNVGIVEALVGEGGVFPCQHCATEIGVSPVAEKTVCARCGKTYLVNRLPVDESIDLGMQQPATEEEDEGEMAGGRNL